MSRQPRRRWDSADELLEEWASLSRLATARQPLKRRRPTAVAPLAGLATAAVLGAFALAVVLVTAPLGGGVASPPAGQTAISTGVSPVPSDDGGLVGAWQLEAGLVDGRPMPLVEDFPVTLVVEPGRTGGTAACNDYGAEISVADGDVRARVTAVTAQLCQEPAMAAEEAYLDALPRVARMSLEGDRLVLSSKGVELRFVRLAPVPIEQIVDRVWLLEELTTDDGGVAAQDGQDATLELRSDGTLQGSTGSRRLTGTWIVYGGEIKPLRLSAHGDDPPPGLASQDSHVIGVLEGFTARVEGDRLTLASRGGDGLVYRLVVAATSPRAQSPPAEGVVISIPTAERPLAPGDPCMAARAGGTLIEHDEWVLALRDATGDTIKVIWPYGWSARRDPSGLKLLNDEGTPVATAGDVIGLGGGYLGDDLWLVCGPVEVLETASPSSRPAGSPTAIPATPAAPAVGNIRPIAPGPLGGRSHHSAVWTGSEMIVWGGLPGERPASDGAAYDPATGDWRPIAASPLGPRYGHSAVWTGAEMLVWGGNLEGEALSDGAAYDPLTDTWRAIGDAAEGRSLHSAVWTGREMLVWGGYVPGGGATSNGLAYDPAAGAWRELAPLPVDPRAAHSAVWTGEVMIAWGGSIPGRATELGNGVIYNPADDSVTPMGRDHLEPRAGHTAIWTGERMLVWGGIQGRPATRGPFADGAAYEPSEQWRLINLVPTAARFSHSAIWTGSEMLVWGGRTGPVGPAVADGFAYDPVALHDCRDLQNLPPVSDDSGIDPTSEVARIVFTAEGTNQQWVRIRYTEPSCRAHPVLGPFIEMLLSDE